MCQIDQTIVVFERFSLVIRSIPNFVPFLFHFHQFIIVAQKKAAVISSTREIFLIRGTFWSVRPVQKGKACGFCGSKWSWKTSQINRTQYKPGSFFLVNIFEGVKMPRYHWIVIGFKIAVLWEEVSFLLFTCSLAYSTKYPNCFENVVGILETRINENNKENLRGRKQLRRSVRK